jgi:hypothetical protein
MADHVVLVQTLHHDDDSTGLLVVQSCNECVSVPQIGRVTLGVRERFLGLHRVVEQNVVGSQSGYDAPNGRGNSITAQSGFEGIDGLTLWVSSTKVARNAAEVASDALAHPNLGGGNSACKM